MSREAMQMALEALESDPISHAGLVNRKQAITALRQALVDADDTSEKRVDEKAKREHEPVCAHVLKTEQEPVLWLKTWPDGSVSVLKTKSHAFADHELEPLYTSPPRKREWVGLTDGEIDILSCEMVKGNKSVNWLCKVLEAKLKEKNNA